MSIPVCFLLTLSAFKNGCLRALWSRAAFCGPNPGHKLSASCEARMIPLSEPKVSNKVAASLLLTERTVVNALVIWKKEKK